MRILIQRVKEAHVLVDGRVVGEIEKGALVFFASCKGDSPKQISWLCQKLVHLRMFPDMHGKMNLSLKDRQASALVVSQFTLYGDCQKGRRPSFDKAEMPEIAQNFYDQFVEEVREELPRVETGVFGAKMEVHLINDGPVTFLIDAP